jgi:hypothetical protein
VSATPDKSKAPKKAAAVKPQPSESSKRYKPAPDKPHESTIAQIEV